MKKSALFPVCILALSLTAGEQVLPRFDTPPVIDGKISASEWGAGYTDSLKSISGKSGPVTKVWFGRDQKNFYAAFYCKDDSIAGIKAQFRTPEERDNAIWNDDSVEIRFDPLNDPKNSLVQRQVIINSNGIVYDAVGRDKKKDFPCFVRTSSGKDFWSVELSIPLAELAGYESGDAELWRIALFRSNPRTKETFSLTGDRAPGFGASEHFLTFRSGNKHSFTVTGFFKDSVEVRADKAADPPLRVRLEQRKADGSPAGRTTNAVLRKTGKTVSLMFRSQKNAKTFRLSAGDGYSIEWAAQPSDAVVFRAVAETKRPLYRELCGPEGPGLVTIGSATWQHGFRVPFLATALDFAIPWNAADMLKIAHDEKLLLIGGTGMMEKQWDNYLGTAPKGTKFTVTTQGYGYESVPVPKAADKRPLLFDPLAEKKWIRNFVHFYTPYRSCIGAVTFGDEQAECHERRFFQLLKYKNEYPFLQQMCEEIKIKYGFGKFGPPESPADRDPYRWIAFRSYIHDQLIRLQRELKKTMTKEFPGVPLISDDPMAGQSKFYDFADFTTETCDIIAHQLYPANDSNIADFSFICKYVRDLAPVQEIHPCFHVENYGAAFTPQETLEKISQGVRAGANGFQWYLADTSGARTSRSLGMDLFGAPERWQAEMAVQREMRSLNKLKFPDADSGVFVSVSTLRAYPGMNLHPEKTRMLHSLLEIQGKVWFRYFNETTLLRKQTDLSRFKAVFVPDAKYCTKDAMKALLDYAEQGGKLVIADPEAFSFTPAAETLERDRIPGMKGMTKRAFSPRISDGKTVLPLARFSQWNLTSGKDSTVLFRYADGKTAVLRSPVGRGEVILFGFNFADRECVTLPEWGKWSRDFLKGFSLKLDQDIWRFRFPDTILKKGPNPEPGKCLTGNYIFFRNFFARTGANDKVSANASYQCIPASDAPAEKEKVLFTQGKLTDRYRAYREGNSDGKKIHIEDRIIGWSTEDPVTLIFDFGKEAEVDRVDLFWHGAMRDAELYASVNGKEWKKCGTYPTGKNENVQMAVAKKVLSLSSPVKARFVKIAFGKATVKGAIVPGAELPGYARIDRILKDASSFHKANFQLMEVEIWSKK